MQPYKTTKGEEWGIDYDEIYNPQDFVVMPSEINAELLALRADRDRLREALRDVLNGVNEEILDLLRDGNLDKALCRADDLLAASGKEG